MDEVPQAEQRALLWRFSITDELSTALLAARYVTTLNCPLHIRKSLLSFSVALYTVWSVILYNVTRLGNAETGNKDSF
jgi:hypothetical protein